MTSANTTLYQLYNQPGPAKQIGATSTNPVYIYYVPAGSSVKIFPTAAGSAKCIFSTSAVSECQADISANNFTSGLAVWEDWGLGTVTAKTSTQLVYSAVTAIVLVATSGTWTLEVCRN